MSYCETYILILVGFMFCMILAEVLKAIENKLRQACERKDLPYDAMTEAIEKSSGAVTLITKHGDEDLRIKGSIDIKKDEGQDAK